MNRHRRNYFLFFALGLVWFQIAEGAERIDQLDTSEDGTFGMVDIVHQGLHLTVDPSERYIRGIVETTFRTMSDSIHSLTLDLSNDLLIDSIQNEDGTGLDFNKNNNHTFTVRFPASLLKDQLNSIRIYYQGIPTENGFGSFVQTSHSTDFIVWTLSEPYGARDWWPCKQNLQDKIDSLDLWITVPTGYQVASNGLLQSEVLVKEGWTEFHWKHRYPIVTYLVAFAVSNYEIHEFEIELSQGNLPIKNFLYPQDFDRHSGTIEEILPSMMALFDSLFIPYPFFNEKYGHAQFGFGGGMEHQTMSFMGGFSYLLTAHELAHQWFGNFVTCGSWQDVWLNEGFASYLTALTYERILQNGTWENYLSSTLRKITNTPDGSLFVSDTSKVGRIFNSRLSYDKGSMVLHMLRWVVGDENFFDGVRSYMTDENARYGFARTSLLKQHLEATSGKDLKMFFEDWYIGEGFPSFHVGWTQSKGRINININQTTSHASVPFFEIPLELGLYGVDRDTFVRFDLTENNQLFELSMDWNVDSVSVDPHHWIISAHNTSEVITSSESNSDEGNIVLYPNPARNFILLENKAAIPIQKIYLSDATGRLKNTENVQLQPGNTTRIHLNKLPEGLYIITIVRRNGERINRKIIIQ